MIFSKSICLGVQWECFTLHMRGFRGGWGSGCFLINHKAIGFRRNTGADSLDKAQSDPGNIQYWAIETPLKWCFAGWSLMAVDCRLLLDETFCIAHFSRIYSNEHLNKCIFGNACIQNLILLTFD